MYETREEGGKKKGSFGARDEYVGKAYVDVGAVKGL